jgi:hypothetical protein
MSTPSTSNPSIGAELARKIQTAVNVVRERGPAGIATILLGKLAARDKRRVTGAVAASWSSYLDWLTFANAGMLDRGNVWSIDYALSHLPSAAPMLEIGSFCGLSTNVIGYLKQRHGVTNRLYTCDRWQFENSDHGTMLGDSKAITHAEYRAFVKATFERNVRFFSSADLPFALELFSDEFFEAWNKRETRSDVFGRECTLGGPLSFCYIDGNHTYENARRDFEHCDEALDRGGFILFDDSADDSGWDVCRVVVEVAASGRYELIAKNPNYLFRKK